MVRKNKRKADARRFDGELWAKILSHKSSYYISRTELGHDDAFRIDDEAQLEIIATIDAITPAQRKHLGGELTLSVLAAEQYAPEPTAAGRFFGSVNMRGSHRSALAYLPSHPFWALPDLIREGACYVCIGWNWMRQGYAELSSVFIGNSQDRTYLLKLGGDTLVRQT